MKEQRENKRKDKIIKRGEEGEERFGRRRWSVRGVLPKLEKQELMMAKTSIVHGQLTRTQREQSGERKSIQSLALSAGTVTLTNSPDLITAGV